MEEMVVVTPEKLERLMKQKLEAAGLHSEHAEKVARHLTFAGASGIHSHGVVRMDYYAERIAKDRITIDPELSFEKTGPSTAIFHGNNGAGQFACNEALAAAVDLAKESGVAYAGVSQTSHSGTLSCYAKKAAERGMVALSMCQSDPMVVPFGGTSNYLGANPIAFAVPRADHEPVVFNMATTVQAWGKILDTRSRDVEIPDTWAVDEKGRPTADPYEVRGLLSISGPKRYGLMMIVDVLAGSLLGLLSGKHVSSMYADLTEKRNLGQIFLVIDPNRFTDSERFKENINQMVEELHCVPTAEGFQQVYYPGEIGQLNYQKVMSGGIEIPQSTYDYLVSEIVRRNKYGGQGAFVK